MTTNAHEERHKAGFDPTEKHLETLEIPPDSLGLPAAEPAAD